MKKGTIFAMAFLLLGSLGISEASSRIQRQNADQSWQQFYSAFRAAVDRRDRASLKRMMARSFETNGGGEFTPARFLAMMKADDWRQLQRSLERGTKPMSGERRPRRVTSDGRAGAPIFEFGRDGRWRWVAVMGD